MLTVAPLTLTFPFALTTYLFVAHTLNAPDQALAAALLAGVVTALVGLFCVGLVKDTYVFITVFDRRTADKATSTSADTLYICYCIDKDVGQRHRDEVFSAVSSIPPKRIIFILICITSLSTTPLDSDSRRHHNDQEAAGQIQIDQSSHNLVLHSLPR